MTPVVAIIDSGIALNHKALEPYIWKNSGETANNGIDDDKNGYVDDVNGWNFSNNTNIVQDNFGHGTHVAGIVASYGAVSIMALKFQDDNGLGFTGDAISAINYAIMMKRDFGVDIVAINNSWGGTTGYSSSLNDAIKRANEVGIIFVAAAGNSGSNNDIVPRYPSSYEVSNVIAVAACGSDNITLAGFSNYGKISVDIAARGTAIYSTLPNNRYGSLSGTSMAAPQVTGAIAALCRKFGDLSMEEIKSRVFSSVNSSSLLSDRVSSGGSLNIRRLLGDDSFVVAVPGLPVEIKRWSERVLSHVDIMNISRIRGWCLDPINISDRIRIKVLINNKEVVVTEANRYRANLTQWADRNHGFDIRLNRRMFVRGWNEVRVIAEDKVTGEIRLVATRSIRRVV
jgi:hypothetical protein